MANETNYIPSKYEGNGVTVEFSFTWKIFNVNDIIVSLEDVTSGVQTVKTFGVDYSVTFSEVGGCITFNSAPTSDYYVIIARDVPEYQSKSYSTSTGFQGSEIENSFDKVSCNLQEIEYSLKRAVKVAVGSPDLDLTLPKAECGKVLKWDNNNKIINSTVDIETLDKVIEDVISVADHAKSAKQYAIGEPEEPIEGSAKYWATQGFQADWEQDDNTKVDYIKNKPDIEQIAESKANVDLANTVPAQSFKDIIVACGMPDYENISQPKTITGIWIDVEKDMIVQTKTYASGNGGHAGISIRDANGNQKTNFWNPVPQGAGSTTWALVPKGYGYKVDLVASTWNTAHPGYYEIPLKGVN